jgi:peptide-methionine (S)-S-oxide reductase
MLRTIVWLAIAATVAMGLVLLWTHVRVAEPEEPTTHAWPAPPRGTSGPPPEGMEQATFGGGCFWCTEAVFQQLQGVRSVVSGYSGGHVNNPTYKQVCSGTTGHAEVIQVTFDPRVLSYPELLEVFWRTHDPTTLNRQGADHGTQYRSVIFYHSAEQRDLAEQYKQQLNAAGVFASPIVTEIAPFTAFYPAEADHQNYYANHPERSYCQVVIRPELQKFEKAFKDKIKKAP